MGKSFTVFNEKNSTEVIDIRNSERTGGLGLESPKEVEK